MGKTFAVTQLSKDRVVIVTGATSGLGYEIAKWTAMMGATVILACRNEEKTMEAIRQMNEEFAEEKAKGTKGLTDAESLALEFLKVDLKSFKSVVEFCEAFKKTGRKLHVLFCNAGAGFGPFERTQDGLEMCLQVNYLSHFLMTAKLLPVMKQSGPDCRILFMSSLLQNRGRFDLKTMNYDGPPSGYSATDYYSNSKMFQIMQMYSMDQRLSFGNITINSISPGIVTTHFMDNAEGCCTNCLVGCFRRLGLSKTPYNGAKCSIDCVVNPDLAGVSGVFFEEFKRTQPCATARNKEKQEQLWKESFRLLKDHLTEEEVSGMEQP